jgi:hypothetical protein
LGMVQPTHGPSERQLKSIVQQSTRAILTIRKGIEFHNMSVIQDREWITSQAIKYQKKF